ncbi:MAG: flagellar type III secretion system pore protein FliP [Deltaproteobacteria bacterium]|nr:flagellar type III secretion system pore protein FliP [Deltaproteobacteria bacterium]
MRFWGVILIVAGGLALFAPADAHAQTGPSIPHFSVSFGESGEPADISTGIKIVLLMTVLTLAPSILVMMTCFTRLAVVMGFLRQAIGTHQVPSNQIIIGLALFLTAFIMKPAFQKIYDDAYVPYTQQRIGYDEAGARAMAPLRDFMLKQTREKDLALFVKTAAIDRPATVDDLPSYIIIPSFILSELKTAFVIGFMVYLPFLVIDMVVAAVLMSMGMMMLPPVMISLPFKLLIFVLADGWYLIVGSLVDSFYA